MKKFLTGEKNRTKKNTTEKMTTPMPMGRKQKKWMSLYMVTHDPKMASYGKKTLFLKDGVIVDTLVKKETNEKYYEKILNKMAQI